MCEDINECFHEEDICPSETFCLNLAGGYKCIDPCEGVDCSKGYVASRSKTSCECLDVNECLTDSCPEGTLCENHEGSHKCIDIDECSTEESNKLCFTGYQCVNTFGSFTCELLKCDNDAATCSATCEDSLNKSCSCPKGYRKDGLLCHKQNPCLTNQGGCEQICSFNSATNLVTCSCNEGQVSYINNL